MSDFNPRTPCGVRLADHWGEIDKKDISIHAPRVGCDTLSSTTASGVMISIHAPRVGCDQHRAGCLPAHHNFNPRTPCGVRLHQGHQRFDQEGISIHAPRVGCDLARVTRTSETVAISIHAPRVGCDGGLRRRGRRLWIFQSTHPVWGATFMGQNQTTRKWISIHAPRVGCDPKWRYFCLTG